MIISRKHSLREDRWLLFCSVWFIALRTLSLFLHFYGPSPYGGPLVESPIRMVFNAVFIETGVILGLILAYRLITWLLGIHSWMLRMPFLIFFSIYLAFAQIDLEFVRWLGEHITLSFIQNYFRKTDGIMLGNLLLSDLPSSLAAMMQIVAPFGFSIWFFKKQTIQSPVRPRAWIFLFVLFLVLVSSPAWFRQSDKRWRRICPVSVSLTTEIYREALGLEDPRDSLQAFADLINYVQTGSLSDTPLTSIPEFPLYKQNGPGKLSLQEFAQLPRHQKPNIVFITFETWRGWKTGLVNDPALPSKTPILDSIIRTQAYYFPYVHSLGFPSVEGTQNIHLGTWPHFRKIIISSYNSIRWKSLPEIFHDFGYQTEIFVGADPSFSNLTPWFRRWYQYTEYSERYTQDGPLIDRFIAVLDTISREKPFFLSTWTVTTHPPYTIPKTEGIPIANTDEERYDQALAYAEKHIVRLIDYLRKSDLWNNTIIVLVGDHSQPETTARNNPDIAGTFTPGHTWVHAAFLGGWPGLPQPQRREETVSLIDIAPTLMELVNISAPNHFMGHSLLHPISREFLGFRWNTVALLRDQERLLFDMFSDYLFYTPLDKSSKINYALLPGHHMPKSNAPPWHFERQRYRDMIFAFGNLLDQDRIFPRKETRTGVYVKR